MADNVESASGSGGPTFASDDISGVQYPRIKLIHGIDGTNDGDVASSNPLPVTAVLSDVDNAVLDTIDAVLDTINAKLVTGTVIGDVNLGATDNAVLDGIQTAVELIDDAVHTDDAVFTLGTSKGVMVMGYAGNMGDQTTNDGDATALLTTNEGVLHTRLSKLGASDIPTDDSSTHTSGSSTGMPIMAVATPTDAAVDSNDFGNVAMSLNRRLHVDIGAPTTGGTTIFRSIDLDESEEEVKATGGQVFWVHAANLSAAVIYLKFYDATAATVVVGTTVPVMTFAVPTQGDTNGAGFVLSVPNGIAFATAITVAATTGVADADTTGPAANALLVNLGYA